MTNPVEVETKSALFKTLREYARVRREQCGTDDDADDTLWRLVDVCTRRADGEIVAAAYAFSAAIMVAVVANAARAAAWRTHDVARLQYIATVLQTKAVDG